MPLEAEEETIVVEVADEVPKDRGFEVAHIQEPIKVESGGEEVVKVADRGDEINAEAQVPSHLLAQQLMPKRLMSLLLPLL